MRAVVVIPTYNEKENLGILVEKIFSLKIPDLELLIIDDSSPDGTGQLAEELAKKFPIKIMHRSEKSGLGRAYVDGFKQVIADKPDFVIQMDADLSHDPAAIPQMLEKAVYPFIASSPSVIASPPSVIASGTKQSYNNANNQTGKIATSDRGRIRDDEPCDLVLGSRYTPGGKIENWDFFRKLISRFGNIYARIILSLPYRDLTGGFKCFRREVLENIDLDSLSSTGYNFQIETTYKAHKKGYKICEIPITFTERKSGVSKFNLGIILESFWKVLLLRFRK